MKTARTPSDPYLVEAVLRALQILDCLDGATEMTLHQISQRTGLNKSRCFRLLHTLVSRHYVERAADGQRYRVGSRLLERAAGSRRDVRELAHPSLVALRDQFNETVNLGLIHNSEVLYIDLVESQRPFRMSAMIGSRMPVVSTAMGKAILAGLEADAAKTLLAGHTGPRTLPAELERVRRLGYAIDKEENEPGVACIGAAIYDANGAPAAAISVSGPVHRILLREREIAKALHNVCHRLSEQLGASPARASSARSASARSAAAGKRPMRPALH